MRSSTSPILIVHQGALGDLLLSLPALLALRRYHRKSPWTLAGNPVNLSLLQRPLQVRDLFSTRGKDWAGLYQEPPRLSEGLAAFLKKFQRIYAFAPRPPELLAENIRQAASAEVVWIPSFPDEGTGRSVPLVQQAVLAARGLPWISSRVYLTPGRRERQEGEALLKRRGLEPGKRPPVWAIHPGSGSRKKNWPMENFLALAEKLGQEKTAAPFFILGPVEKDIQPEARALINARGFPVLEDVTPAVLSGALSRVAGYLGNDSGVTHLASCLNLPTVALFGPTDPRLWGPVGGKTVVLQTEPPVPAAHSQTASRLEDNPWKTLTVELVFEECLRLMKSV